MERREEVIKNDNGPTFYLSLNCKQIRSKGIVYFQDLMRLESLEAMTVWKGKMQKRLR